MLLSRRLLQKVGQPFVSQLERVLGKESVKVTDAAREQHSHDEGHHLGKAPDVVVLPQNVEQVSAVMKMCHEGGIPVIPFGTGTGLEGGVNALKGGVSIDLMTMDKIVEVNTNDFDSTVEPGVTHETLNKHLHNTGLWFSVDPGADASICGMAATAASGTNAVRYGTMVQNVLNLEVVLPNGDILYTAGKGRRPRKSAAGYNLTKLFVGSEGTLGVITQATVRLQARPAICSAAICPFPTVSKAIEAVVATLQCSVPIAKIEFMDANTVTACNRYSKLTLAESPTLFLEFHGNSEAEVAAQATLVGEIFAGNDGTQFTWSHAPEEQKKLWAARHSVYYAIVSQKPNVRGFTTDVCVPISALAKVVTETREDIDKSGVFGAIVGHVGDGNFHCIFPSDETNDEEMKIIWGLSDRVVKRALAAGGSCTGEHGIGIGKRQYLTEEYGEVGLKTMMAIKKALDPKGIMNPVRYAYLPGHWKKSTRRSVAIYYYTGKVTGPIRVSRKSSISLILDDGLANTLKYNP